MHAMHARRVAGALHAPAVYCLPAPVTSTSSPLLSCKTNLHRQHLLVKLQWRGMACMHYTAVTIRLQCGSMARLGLCNRLASTPTPCRLLLQPGLSLIPACTSCLTPCRYTAFLAALGTVYVSVDESLAGLFGKDRCERACGGVEVWVWARLRRVIWVFQCCRHCVSLWSCKRLSQPDSAQGQSSSDHRAGCRCP